MAHDSRPNYFILLDIDPQARWSDEDFEQTLLRKRGEWSKNTTHPKKGPQYSGYLEMVPDITRVMTDPELRAQEAKQADELKNAARREARQQFNEDLELRAARGYLTEDDIQKLIKTYSPDLSESDIRTDIKRAGIDIRTPDDYPEPQKMPTLDSSQFANINQKLSQLGHDNLYEFLGMSESSRTSDLHEAANDILAENLRIAEKTAELTTSSELAGLASNVFKDDKQRQLYDNARAEDAYKTLANRVRRIVGSDKTLYAAQYEMLLEKARRQGLNLETAGQHIRHTAREAGIAVQITEAVSVSKRIRCPNCHTVSSETTQNCPECSTPLRIQCPGCGQTTLTEHQACPNCGFPIGNLPNVRQLVSDGEMLLEQGRYDEALYWLKLAQRQWSTIPPRPFNDELSRLINTCIEEAESAQQAITQQQLELQRAIDNRHFYAARDTLRELEAQHGPEPYTAERQTITKAIQQAERTLQRAHRLESQGIDVVEEYQQILQRCADCQAAKDALARTPPHPPHGVSARLSGHQVSLSWQPSPSKGVRYTVVRKAGAQPISAQDGQRIATVAGTNYNDTALEIGRPLYYGIYANREDIFSTDAALLSAPVLLAAPVSDVSKEIDDGQVRLRWTPPPNADGIQVVRSTKRRPTTRLDGQRVKVLNHAEVHDHQLNNGQRYFYAIFSLFKDHRNNTVASEPVFIEAIPEPPPAIIKSLSLDVLHTTPDHKLRLSWPRPPKGQGVVLRSPAKPRLRAGDVISLEELQTRGKILPGQNGEVTTTVSSSQIVYFTPVVLAQGMGYIGETQEYVSLDDVSNLRVQNQKSVLQLTWDWPPNCQHAIVAYSYTDYPAVDDPTATTIEITKAEYNLRGCYLIHNPPQQDHYIVVYAALVENGERLIASGITPSARQLVSLSSTIEISYTIKRERKLFGKGPLLLELTVQGSGTLPALMLVGKQSLPPLNKTDGELVERIPELYLNQPKSVLTYTLADSAERLQSFGRLFLEDDNMYDTRGGHIRINHPLQDKMRLF